MPSNGSFRPHLLFNYPELPVSLLGLYAVTTMEPLRYIRISLCAVLWHAFSSHTPARTHAGDSCSEFGSVGPSGPSALRAREDSRASLSPRSPPVVAVEHDGCGNSVVDARR